MFAELENGLSQMYWGNLIPDPLSRYYVQVSVPFDKLPIAYTWSLPEGDGYGGAGNCHQSCYYMP